MATTMTINNISGIFVERIDPGFNSLFNEIPVPGGESQVYEGGTHSFDISITGAVYEAGSAANAKNKWLQLVEMMSNPWHRPIYFQFAANENVLDGWYAIRGMGSMPRDKRGLIVYPFQLNISRIGTLGSHRLGTIWKAAAETTSGFTTPTATSMISLPYLVTNVGWAVTATHGGSDGGSSQLLENPTRSPVLYQSSATIANWFLSEARVYDSVSAGDTTEGNWVQVLDKHHIFGGDQILQNAMMRYKINSNAGTFYAYDSDAAAWKTVGEFKTALTGNLAATIKQIEILRISPDEVRWKEWRHNGANPLLIEYTLRRGAWYCRAKVTTFSLGIDTTSYVQLYKTSGFVKLFNAGANGDAGAGDLAQQASSNYECGYDATDDIVKCFALCDQPTKQPYDPGATGHYLPVSLTWGTSTTRTIFIAAWHQETNPIVLATGRANAAATAAYCLKSVEQSLDLVPSGWY